MALPLIAYNSGIPNPANNPSVDVTPMQQNTGYISQIIATDHVPFGVNASGTHMQANFLNTSTTGTPVLPSTRGGVGFETLYSSAQNPATPTVNPAAALGNAGELFFVRGGNTTQIQLTGPGTPAAAINGSTFLPGGILVQWGTVYVFTGTSTDVSFPITFPNALFFVQAQPFLTVGNIPSLQLNGYATNGGTNSDFKFFMINPANMVGFTWYAVGY